MDKTAQILVTLLNADPTALTARTCLQRWLGFGGRLLDIRRAILWEVTCPESAEIDVGLSLLRKSSELWNPNKESASFRLPDEPAGAFAPPGCGGGAWQLLLAWDPERDLDRVVRPLLGLRREGWRLARATLWALRWETADAAEAERWSVEAALCRGPKEGLLIHPHLEDHRRIDSRQPSPWLPRATQ